MRYKSCNCIFCNCSHSEDNPITKDHIPSLRKGRCCYRSGYILKVQYMATSVTTGKRWIVGFVKDDLSRVMGIWGRCKFAGETFHGFCEAPGGFSFSALIWYWGSIRFNSVYLWFGRFADDNFTRSEMPHSGNQPIQVSGKESVTLLGQLLNLQQGVDDSLRKLTQLKYPARCQWLT